MIARMKRSSTLKGDRPPVLWLDRRDATEFVDYDAYYSRLFTEDFSVSTSSLTTRPLEFPDRNSFRILGGGGSEMDRIYRSLGVSGPKDLAISFDAWEACKRSSYNIIDSEKFQAEAAKAADSLGLDNTKLTLAPRTSTRDSFEGWNDFFELLRNRQLPRSLSGCTAVEFLSRLPSDKIEAIVDNLTSANFFAITGDHNENHFGTPIFGKHANGEKNLNPNYQSLPGGYKSETTGRYHDDDKEDLFEICLTTSDVGNLDRLVVTANKDAGKYFRLATILTGTDSLLRLEDGEGKTWLFGFSYPTNISQSYEFTKGWGNYVKEKKLRAGDFVFFQRSRTDGSKLFIGFRRRGSGGAALGDDDAHEFSPSAVLNSTSPATSDKTLELRENLEEVDTPFQLRSPEHRIKGFEPILVISCGDNQDSEEKYFISYIFNELSLHGFTPLRCDLTWSIAIENPEMLYRSRVAIIVFSMNYACSRECLDGFVAIMDHLKANNLLSIPVFFKVSLPDVRGQSGSFEKAFTRLENSVQASQVLKWRAAMIELTSINTYQYMKGDEVMLAKNIVRDVCLLLNSETNKKLQGMRLQLKRILSLLNCSQTSSPQIVGLWGMAGIGKTTITREIFRTQAERYDVCYFLPDFDLMCQTKGLSHLREEFFSKIFGEENSFINACDTKLSFTRDRFLGKSVLIVVDGVSNARDAEVLVGGFGWFSGGHSIILTSRNRQVLVQCKAKEIYEIQKLSEPESLRLCCQFATEQNWKERMSLISELLNYASGNPLVLQVLGLSIQKQCIDDEKQHLRRLRQHPPIKIQDAFRRSFNGLDDNEKNIFLDLACFFRGENKDLVVNILDGCGFLTDLGIYSLIDESLISLVDNRIEMPNIFQDTGRFVVCQEHEEAGKLSRLSDSNDTADVLTNNSGTEAIEGIFLDASGLELEMSATVFERMYRLRLLKLHCPTSENHSKVCLPQGLHSLPDELRLLHWEGYPLGSLPRNFNPINLVELNMPYSNLTKLWKGTKNLEKLKRIILSHSRQLTKFPRLSKARNLEHIDLEGCTSLVKVNSSILHHHKLTFLSLKDCSHLRFMPTTVHLESLEVLNLSGCAELEDFQGFSPNLKELYLAGTAIREMPSSIGDLTKLVTLDLENCNRLQHLPQEISNLKTLVTLCAKRPASSMNLSSVEDTAPAYKRHRLKRVIETVILSLRKRKRGKCVSRATNQVHRGSASTSANDPSSFCGFHVLPERPDQSKCLFYMKTGDCKFGNACKFHHPKDREISLRESSLSPIGLPLRPGKPLCPLYFHNGNCSSGPTCNFDHPSLVLTHKNTSSVASETLHLSTLRVSSTIEDSSRDSSRDSSSEFVEASTKKPRTDKNTSFVASKTLHLSPLRFSSSIGDSSRDSSGDSSSELVEAPTMKPRTHKNPYSVASETLHLSPLRFSSTIGDSSRDSSSEPVEASTKKPKTHKNPSSVASETLHLNPLRFSSLNGDSSRDSSSEPVEASTKKPRTHKNTSSVASKTLHLSRLGLSSSIGDSSSELVKASTVSEVIQATDDGDTTYVANFSEEELDLLGSSLTYPPSSICKPTQSAAQINEVSRARSLEKKLTKEFGDSEFGVCVRSPKTRKSRRSDSEGSVHDAAIRIQSEFRGFKCRKRHLITIQGIVLIQARWRGYQVRKNYRNSVL